jgi:hypothetical protein
MIAVSSRTFLILSIFISVFCSCWFLSWIYWFYNSPLKSSINNFYWLICSVSMVSLSASVSKLRFNKWEPSPNYISIEGLLMIYFLFLKLPWVSYSCCYEFFNFCLLYLVIL